METQARLRPPHLQPLWTDSRRSGGYPPSPYAARDSAYSPGIRSPNMPSPLYPRSGEYDHSMRRHERAMVDRLDQRNWQGPPDSPTSPAPPRSLAPITELNGRDRRSSIAYPPHSHAYSRSSHSPPRPLEYDYDYSRRPTLADESRSILLSRPLEPSRPADQASYAERRRSLPPSFAVPRRVARPRQRRQQELQAWGHVYLGNGSEADCFVAAVALRRPSDASYVEDNAAEREKEYRSRNRLTIRARIRPRALNRSPFVLERTFDMDELRATVPDPEPTSPASRRQSADYPNRKAQPYDPTKPEREPERFSARSLKAVKTVPIHLQYARVYFPVIAALILSDYVQTGDIIDFPLPHPEAWKQTVAHVYTGQGELTEAIKENILYLGGKV
ncbi:hypothetical protein QBC37DRAFT_60 [Rhypophila decipiens]|uniref:Uncharacterized protein n=1 Tax=Rhypophila decipiens TaxID=261697 RepID=A0AAN6YK87_9PEZI|nr:hypothetical protein QBC37DRAFT_60 [Rhypophila decipiens]